MKRFEEYNNASRLTIRTITTKKLYNLAIEEIRKVGLNIEGIIESVEGDYIIIYIGKNKYERSAPEEEKNLIRANLEKARNDNKIARDGKRDYSVYILRDDKGEKDELKEFLSLGFGWNNEQADSIINSENNIIAYAKNEEVLGMGIVERAEVNLQDIKITLYELTEAFVSQNSRGKNVYTSISNLLINEVMKNANKETFLYGESNLRWIPMAYVVIKQGRLVSLDVCKAIGLNDCYLEQHVPISDGLSEYFKQKYGAKYNTLVPTFIKRT